MAEPSLRFMRIGLTGGSGSGKSLVASILLENGVPSLDTDAVVHSLYEGGEYPQTLASLFGDTILTPTGAVDRMALAAIVFADREKLALLNKTVHGAVREICLRFLREQEAAGFRAAVIDAPQLFEAGMEGDFDRIIAVYAPKKDRVKRIMERDGITRAAAERRLASQKPASFFKAHCDLLIKNPVGSDRSSLTAQLLPLLRQIKPTTTKENRT